MEDVKGSWGGKRAGAGRPKGSTKEDSNICKQHQVRAHEEEWELIQRFARLVKHVSKEECEKALEKLEAKVNK